MALPGRIEGLVGPRRRHPPGQFQATGDRYSPALLGPILLAGRASTIDEASKLSQEHAGSVALTQEIRVALVGSSEHFGHLARLCLKMESGFVVVGDATDGPGAIAMATRVQPDIILLDLDMPAMCGLASIPAIRACSPRSRIAVLSSFPDPFTLSDTLSWGADTYLDRTTSLWGLTTICRSLLSE